MTIFYSAGAAGFFHRDVHGEAIPDDVVEISAEQHRELLEGQAQGQRIVPDAGGAPVLALVEASADERLASIRRRRDQLLAASDWRQLPDVGSAATRKAWAAYRQELREFPTVAAEAIINGRDNEWPPPPG